MTPKEALDNLSKASGEIQTNRATHMALIESVKVLQEVIEREKNAKETSEKKEK